MLNFSVTTNPAVTQLANPEPPKDSPELQREINAALIRLLSTKSTRELERRSNAIIQARRKKVFKDAAAAKRHADAMADKFSKFSNPDPDTIFFDSSGARIDKNPKTYHDVTCECETVDVCSAADTRCRPGSGGSVSLSD